MKNKKQDGKIKSSSKKINSSSKKIKSSSVKANSNSGKINSSSKKSSSKTIKISSKTIKIKVKGSETRNIDELKPFQGELKILTDENYKKLRNEILDLGFCEPICVWKQNILNGHQRIKTLKRMRDEEGYIIPNIPVNIVNATNFKEAKKMVLSLTSQFGKMTEESLIEFIKLSDLDLSEIIGDFEFAGLDMDFLENFNAEDNNFIEPLSDEELSDMVKNSDFDFLLKLKNEIARLIEIIQNNSIDCDYKSMAHEMILKKISEINDEYIVSEYRKQ